MLRPQLGSAVLSRPGNKENLGFHKNLDQWPNNLFSFNLFVFFLLLLVGGCSNDLIDAANSSEFCIIFL